MIQKASRAAVILLFLMASIFIIHKPAVAQQPTLTLVNRSSLPALVRVKGPTKADVQVPGHSKKTIAVKGGNYFIKIRFGTNEKNYIYSKGQPFSVLETPTRIGHVTIIFNTTKGNYSTRPISKREFWK